MLKIKKRKSMYLIALTIVGIIMFFKEKQHLFEIKNIIKENKTLALKIENNLVGKNGIIKKLDIES